MKGVYNVWNPFEEDFTVVKTIFSWIGKALLVIVPVLAVGYLVFVLFRTGPATPLSDPLSKYFIPEAKPSATPYLISNPWESETWLASSEARALRDQENVINLAFLEDGQALYSKDHSLIFTEESWARSKPLGIDDFNIDGTYVHFTVKGADYNLNVYQPFVLSDFPNLIYIADLNGSVWVLDLASANKVSIQEAVETLTVEIAPNPDLTFTY